jgi:hypothetical protein
MRPASKATGRPPCSIFRPTQTYTRAGRHDRHFSHGGVAQADLTMTRYPHRWRGAGRLLCFPRAGRAQPRTRLKAQQSGRQTRFLRNCGREPRSRAGSSRVKRQANSSACCAPLRCQLSMPLALLCPSERAKLSFRQAAYGECRLSGLRGPGRVGQASWEHAR